MNNIEIERENLKQNFSIVIAVLDKSGITLKQLIDFVVAFLIVINDEDKETYDRIIKIVEEVSKE